MASKAHSLKEIENFIGFTISINSVCVFGILQSNRSSYRFLIKYSRQKLNIVLIFSIQQFITQNMLIGHDSYMK